MGTQETHRDSQHHHNKSLWKCSLHNERHWHVIFAYDSLYGRDVNHFARLSMCLASAQDGSVYPPPFICWWSIWIWAHILTWIYVAIRWRFFCALDIGPWVQLRPSCGALCCCCSQLWLAVLWRSYNKSQSPKSCLLLLSFAYYICSNSTLYLCCCVMLSSVSTIHSTVQQARRRCIGEIEMRIFNNLKYAGVEVAQIVSFWLVSEGLGDNLQSASANALCTFFPQLSKKWRRYNVRPVSTGRFQCSA